MPTSKHRKKHKAKVKQRRNEIAQKKNAYNKQLRKYEEQIEAINKQYQEHLANGGKPEEFQPLQQMLKNIPVAEPAVVEDAPMKDDDDGAEYGTYPENNVEEVKNEVTE